MLRQASLCRCGHRFLTIAQRFLNLSTHPQPMYQYRQLSRHRHHHPFLAVFPSSRGEFLPPTPQITVFSKGSEYVVRSLHRQRPYYSSPQLTLQLSSSQGFSTKIGLLRRTLEIRKWVRSLTVDADGSQHKSNIPEKLSGLHAPAETDPVPKDRSSTPTSDKLPRRGRKRA